MNSEPFNPPINPDDGDRLKKALLKGRIEAAAAEKKLCYHTGGTERCKQAERLPANAKCTLCGRIGTM
ncbi:hypothetical protein [Ralstonia sp. ASV6]|uniref:hypothetical protein n=1 Tax=Ralstonia sp. ASV6 TaxID=2795124 RepID=UPI0018EE0D08|nr:hypothetical protein [Ralstonia sp. ASV6]